MVFIVFRIRFLCRSLEMTTVTVSVLFTLLLWCLLCTINILWSFHLKYMYNLDFYIFQKLRMFLWASTMKIHFKSWNYIIYILYCSFFHIANIFLYHYSYKLFLHVHVFSSAIVHHLVNILTHKSLHICGFSPGAMERRWPVWDSACPELWFRASACCQGEDASFLFKNSYKKMFFGSFFQTLGTVLKWKSQSTTGK